ncbi:MAG TPA: SprT family zinc-dependent metalloprotease [Armatimonadota bacterium]|jgi:hypothetical protein
MGVAAAPNGEYLPPPSPEACLPPYTIRRSARAKRMRLRVDVNGGVEVVLPQRAPARAVAPFVAEHADWIRHTRERFAALRQQRAESGPAGERTVSYRGRDLPLRVEPSMDGRLTLQYRDDHFAVHTRPDSSDEEVKSLLTEWYRRVARPLFEERVMEMNLATGYEWKRIRIGEQKTRWGSCSTSGTLSFNWRLLMAPPEILDYVVIHELAHLREPNHSAAFWALVRAQCPDYAACVRWLKANGPALALAL